MRGSCREMSEEAWLRLLAEYRDGPCPLCGSAAVTGGAIRHRPHCPLSRVPRRAEGSEDPGGGTGVVSKSVTWVILWRDPGYGDGGKSWLRDGTVLRSAEEAQRHLARLRDDSRNSSEYMVLKRTVTEEAEAW
jgi:hypothetical protein